MDSFKLPLVFLDERGNVSKPESFFRKPVAAAGPTGRCLSRSSSSVVSVFALSVGPAEQRGQTLEPPAVF